MDMQAMPMIYVERKIRTNDFTMPHTEMHDGLYEIYYLLSGTRNYFIENENYAIQSGDLVLVNNHDIHRTFSSGDRSVYERIFMFIREDFFQALSHWLPYDPRVIATTRSAFDKGIKHIRLSHSEQTTVEKLLFTMLQEQEKKQTSHRSYMMMLTFELLLHIGRIVESRQDEGPGTALADTLPRKIKDVIDYINLRFAEDIPLFDTARRFHFSPHYLSRVFKQSTGFSYVEYINSIRIKHAQTMLRETDRKIIHIAESVGFEQISHFGKVFKKLVQLTPSQYRKLSRQT